MTDSKLPEALRAACSATLHTMRTRSMLHRTEIPDDQFEVLVELGLIRSLAFAGYWERRPTKYVGDRESRARQCYDIYGGCPLAWEEAKDEWVKGVEAYENRPSPGSTSAERLFNCLARATAATFVGGAFFDMVPVLREHPR